MNGLTKKVKKSQMTGRLGNIMKLIYKKIEGMSKKDFLFNYFGSILLHLVCRNHMTEEMKKEWVRAHEELTQEGEKAFGYKAASLEIIQNIDRADLGHLAMYFDFRLNVVDKDGIMFPRPLITHLRDYGIPESSWENTLKIVRKYFKVPKEFTIQKS